jgi:hypothetical protein
LDTDPYGSGWIAKLNLRPKSRGLQEWVPGPKHAELFKRQSDAVLAAFTEIGRHHRSAVGPTLYDGGTGLSDLESLLGPTQYFEFVNKIFRLALMD